MWTQSHTKITTANDTNIGCRSFMGMENFLSMFCPEMQKLLKPIYNLTRKGRQFIWGREQQDAFKEIKCRLFQAPTVRVDFTYIQTQVHLPQGALYIKFRMENQS